MTRRPTAFLSVLLLLAAAACGPVRPDDPKPRPGAHARRMLLQQGFLEIRIEAPDVPAGPKPTVVSYLEELRGPLLDAGFTVVSYVLHWELLGGGKQSPKPPPADAPPPKTVGKWLLTSPSADVIGKGYLSLIDSNARGTVPAVLDALASDPDVDPSRIGIVGFSTNGFTALQAGSLNPRLRAVVALAACGDYHTFLHQSSLAMNGETLALAPDYDRWIRDVEPVRHPARLVHAAVLLVNGRKDLPIPFACAESTATAFRRAYARAGSPERFRWVVIDEGHVMGPRAKEEAVAWLGRWLADR